MGESEQQEVMQQWSGVDQYNADSKSFKPEPIHEWFESAAVANPARVALRYEGVDVEYKALSTRADCVAQVLHKNNVGAGKFVPLMAERCIEMMVGLLGILKAGAAYVPFAPYMPADRLQFMAEDCGAQVILVTEGSVQAAESVGLATVLVLGSDHFQQHDGFTLPSSSTSNVMICLYTSGSTGQPKAVALSHLAIASHLDYIIHDYSYSASDKYLQTISYTFVASVPELLGVLMVGGCVVLSRPDVLKDLQALGECMRRESITLVQFIPSVMSSFVEVETLAETVRCLILTGEPLPLALLTKVTTQSPELNVLNHYGCTEVTDTTTVWKTTGPPTMQSKNVPVGRPVRHRIVLVLDEFRRPVPLGAPGELYAAGCGLANEYLNRDELTEEKFPRQICGQERVYATGDLVRWMHDGQMECLGRIDFQVKVNGLRIELGEIEGALQKADGLKEAAVLLQDKTLIAYVSPKPDGDGSSLLEHCSRMLPAYMVPVAVVGMDEWPRNANGKLDRKALPKWQPDWHNDDPNSPEAAAL